MDLYKLIFVLFLVFGLAAAYQVPGSYYLSEHSVFPEHKVTGYYYPMRPYKPRVDPFMAPPPPNGDREAILGMLEGVRDPETNSPIVGVVAVTAGRV